jgi:hypothetical protein
MHLTINGLFHLCDLLLLFMVLQLSMEKALEIKGNIRLLNGKSIVVSLKAILFFGFCLLNFPN